ncbi:MAG TPA: threonylcarbamoyl-AMP synthase [Clostridiales bacterium]|nr:threonylcarbamoyl-AMP synthase [Clostridiales bacterium]
MDTKLLKITSSKDTEQIKTAAEILKSGGIVAIPTETVYGLAANAYNTKAIQRIFAAKGRPQDNPLIVHIAEKDTLYELAVDIPETAFALADRFWPGPLTIILKKSQKLPDSVTAGLGTVAIRLPSNEVARAIIKMCGFPLAAPSANLSGRPSPTSAEHVIMDLYGKIDAIVLSDNSEVGVESTVITLASDRPRLLRPGAVTPEDLRQILPDLQIDPAVFAEPEPGVKVQSPGMKYKHYSPKAKIVLVEGNSPDFIRFVNSKKGPGVYALCFSDDAQFLEVPYVIYGKTADEKEQASHLFSALRELDSKSAKIAYAHAPKKDGIGLAVYNRLIRAAAFEVVRL